MNKMETAILFFLVLAFLILWGYTAITAVKRRVYTWLNLRSSGALPNLIVGNLTVGGTGKTPMVMFLIDAFAHQHVGVLSRGYGRKSHGFLPVNRDSKAEEVGDEPLEILQAFPDVPIYVCEDRLEGLARMKEEQTLDWVILDDGFQHLKLLPTKSMILTDYNRPFWKEYFAVPFGSLREFRLALKAADILVITKCPKDLQEEYMLEIAASLHFPKENIYAAHYAQSDLAKVLGTQDYYPEKAILISGIAHSDQIIQHLQTVKVVEHLKYRDHHDFSIDDVQLWLKKCNEKQLDSLIFTRKDWQRLINSDLKELLKNEKINVWEIHTNVEILWNKKEDLLQKIDPIK